LLCCILAALFALPLLWWPAMRRPACCGPGALPLVLFGVSFSAGVGLLCLVLFTASGAAAFHHLCSVAGWVGKAN